MKEPVRISMNAGDGKKHVVEVDASVWLRKISVIKRSGRYYLGLDAVEIVMPEEVGYEFIEDTALMLPYRDRKRLAEALSESI